MPGNSTYSTTDFLAMNYEAKCAATSAIAAGLTTPNSGNNTYSDSANGCTSANSKAVASVASQVIQLLKSSETTLSLAVLLSLWGG